MGRLAQGALLLVIGALIIALVYWEPEWLTQWADYAKMRQWILIGAWILCSAGLALVTYAIGFALAEQKYTLRISSLTERVSSLTERIEEKRRDLRDLSQKLEWERRELATARRQVAAAVNQLVIKRRQLAVLSGKLGDKEKRLKKIRKVVGAS